MAPRKKLPADGHHFSRSPGTFGIFDFTTVKKKHIFEYPIDKKVILVYDNYYYGKKALLKCFFISISGCGNKAGNP